MIRKINIITLLFFCLFSIQAVPVFAATDPETVSIIVDRTAPDDPTITVDPAGWTNQNVTVTFANISDTGGAGVEKLQYSTDGGTTIHEHLSTEDLTITLSNEGEYNIQAQTFDTVGHSSNLIDAMAQIDKSKPTINITGAADGETYYAAVSPNYEVNDTGGSEIADTTVTMNKDGEVIAWNNGDPISQAGSYQLDVTSTDNAANSETMTINFVLSAPTAPEAPVITASSSTVVHIECNSPTGAESLSIFRDGEEPAIASIEPGGSFDDNTLTPNTEHSYVIKAINTLGETVGPSASTWTLANIPTGLQVSERLSESVSIGWEANSNPAGTEYLAVIEDGEGYSDSTVYTADMLSHTFAGLETGKEYTVSIKARNGALVETEAAVINALTNKAPVVTIDSPAENQVFSDEEGYKTINVSGTVTDEDDDTVTIAATINGISKPVIVENCAASKPYQLVFDIVDDAIPEGTYTVEVIADDGK